MANITAELQAIMNAVYGEQVRSSIHDAIKKINDVNEKVLDAGDAYEDGDSSEGYFDESIYINTDTYKMLKSNGTTWGEVADLKGVGITDISKTSTVGNVDTYTITLSDGSTETFTVTNGTQGEPGNRWFRGTDITGTASNPTQFVLDFEVNANDGYINPSTGAVYHCTQGAAANVGSLWVYDFMMTGGGGGATAWGDLTGKPFSTVGTSNGLTISNDELDVNIPITSADSSEFTVSNGELSLSSDVNAKLSNFNNDGSIASGSELDDALTAKSKVMANPTLAGTEDAITGIEIDNVKYKIEGGGGVSGYVLVVTTNSELNGQMLTATKGSKTKRGLVANNQCRISLDEGGIWIIEEPINHHTVNTENLVYYGEYQYKLKSYTIYGFHVDDSKSNPTPSAVHENDMVSYHVQYGGENVDNYNYDYGYMDFANDEWRKGSWSDDEFFMPRPVLLKQDFSDKIYLNPYDLTRDVNGNSVNDKLTGSTDGYNAMMEFGRDGLRIWYKVVPDATPTSYTVYVSDIQLDSGFHAWSFYDCNDELMEHFYMAIYNGSNVSSVLRSLSGKSILNNVAGTTEISYAKANNKNSETYAWYIDVYADRVLINFLMMLVIRSANSDRIGYGNYTGGSSASSLLQTGLGNTKGFFYGKQSNGVVKVFGIENYFANQWRRCAGYSLVNGVIKYKITYGTADGSSSSGYIESTSAPTNYLSGNSIATNFASSAIVKETAKNDGSLLPSAFGGSTSTNYCDSIWSTTGTSFALVGGPCTDSAACGAFCVNLYAALSYTRWGTGAALSCKPPIMLNT